MTINLKTCCLTTDTGGYSAAPASSTDLKLVTRRILMRMSTVLV